jgi:hypothetical protein
MADELKKASQIRQENIFFNEIDNRLDLLLANYQRVTANPRSMGYLRFLLRHYAKSATPWRDCYRDNLKRFGPEKTKGICSVLKDTLRQSTHWRGHPTADVGSPGVAIADADAKAAPPWGGHKHLSETNLDMGLEMAMPEEISLILEDIGSKCNIHKVLVGLENPPTDFEIVV